MKEFFIWLGIVCGLFGIAWIFHTMGKDAFYEGILIGALALVIANTLT